MIPFQAALLPKQVTFNDFFLGGRVSLTISTITSSLPRLTGLLAPYGECRIRELWDIIEHFFRELVNCFVEARFEHNFVLGALTFN